MEWSSGKRRCAITTTARMKLTIFADIASRVMHATQGSPRTVAGAVAVDTLDVDQIRKEVHRLPKWGRCSEDDAEFAVDLMSSQAVAFSVVSVNRETEAWKRFLVDAQLLHEAIVESGKVAGWAKPTNLLKFILLGSSCAAAMGHALGVDRRAGIINTAGRRIVECSTVCDSEIEGEENLEVFTSFWSKQHIPKSRLARAGYEVIADDVRVTSEEAEPVLLLADYAAGLGLAAATSMPGRVPLPLDQGTARRLLCKIRDRGKLTFHEEEFEYTYDEIFKDVMEEARGRAESRTRCKHS